MTTEAQKVEVSQEDVKKALGALQDVTKGHSSRGTATTQVESMQQGGVGAGSDAGSTQVFHTPANSDPNGWAGSTAKDCGEDGAHDAISENGTDYDGGAMYKSIKEKIAKGQTLSPDEYSWFFEKGGMAYGFDKDKDKDKDKEVDKAVDAVDKSTDIDKSLTDHASENDTVRQGLEVSEFLQQFADVFQKSQESQESRIVERVYSLIKSAQVDSNEFSKSLGDAVTKLAELSVANGQRIEQVESQPARGPMSAASVSSIEKSFEEGGAAPSNELSKAQVNDALFGMLQKGEIDRGVCLKFDATNEIDPVTLDKVRKSISAG